MKSRREFLQFSAVVASIFAGGSFPAVSSPKNLVMEDLLKFNSKGQITLLHITDIHGQLKPEYLFSENKDFEGIEVDQNVDKLKKFENVILTPHIAGWSNESKIKLAQITVDKIKDFLDL